MTIVQLEYLIAVANYGNFSVAAEHCFVTQPSLSTQIKNLEEELGVILLNRNEKPMTPTDAGRIVIEKARHAICGFYEIGEAIRELKSDMKGVLRLAVIPTIAPYLLHRFIPVFVEKYPDLHVVVQDMFTRDIIKALRNDTIDIAILAGGFTDPQEIIEEDLYRDYFYLYTSKKHALYNKEVVAVKDINVDDLLLLSDGHCLRTQIVDLCKAANRSASRFSFESGSLETIMRIVDTSSSITIIPEMAASIIDQDRRGQLKQLENDEAFRNISLAVSKNFFKKGMYQALKETIIENSYIL